MIQTTNKIFLIAIGIILVVFSVWPSSVRADDAFLSIFPQTGSFTSGNTFEISVFLNTGGNNVNAVEANLQFDPQKLQVVSPTKGLSVIGEWIFPPSFSNTKGTVTLVGGFLKDGINTSEGLISTIVFEAISPGTTELTFLDSCKVLVGEEGNNILRSMNKAVYDILPPPFKGLRIFSETHPNQDQWYKNNSPSFNWEKIEGTEGYSFSLDDDPYGEPDNVIDSFIASASFEDVKDGVLYFHLKAKKDGMWGSTSHYQINIDNTSPLEFEPYLESFSFGAGNYLLVYFNTKDILSGLDHYNTRVADFTDPENVFFSGWIRQESPLRLTKTGKGVFEVQVRAFDKAGNFQEGKMKVRVVVNPYIVIVSGGIQFLGIFIAWWQIYVLVTAVLIGLGLLIFSIIKRVREDVEVDLQKEIKEAEKEIEDVRKAEEKLKKLRIKEEEAGREWKRLKEDLEDETEDKPET